MGRSPLLFIILSASLFGVSVPFAKVLVGDISPLVLAGLLYLGAFAGLSFYAMARRMIVPDKKTVPLVRKDVPWLAGAILSGGILGPISLMMGLTLVSGFSASLLLNLEGLATVLIAVIIFRENAGKRLWIALACMTIAGIFLAWNPTQSAFTIAGPLLIVFAMVCWGIDNNLTRNISEKDPIQITQIKGLVAGATSISIALLLGIRISLDLSLIFALILGSFSYGISLVFFVKALKGLGSSRAGTFFSFAPFIGAVTSLFLLHEWIGWTMLPAVVLMLFGIWLIGSEKHSHFHVHKSITHTHSHVHTDLHHIHDHIGRIHEPHSHEHTHDETSHAHVHYPDTHHRHEHEKQKTEEK